MENLQIQPAQSLITHEHVIEAMAKPHEAHLLVLGLTARLSIDDTLGERQEKLAEIRAVRNELHEQVNLERRHKQACDDQLFNMTAHVPKRSRDPRAEPRRYRV